MPKAKISNYIRRRKQVESIRSEEKFAMHPCDRCIEKGLVCQVSADSDYCASCMESKSSCLLIITDADRSRMKARKAFIRKKLKDQRRRVAALRRKQATKESLLADLEDELALAKQASRKMFAQEMFNIEALEEDERQEREGATIDSSEALSPSFFESFDPGILGLLYGTDEAAPGSS